jgi:hypothetical protein
MALNSAKFRPMIQGTGPGYQYSADPGYANYGTCNPMFGNCGESGGGFDWSPWGGPIIGPASWGYEQGIPGFSNPSQYIIGPGGGGGGNPKNPSGGGTFDTWGAVIGAATGVAVGVGQPGLVPAVVGAGTAASTGTLFPRSPGDGWPLSCWGSC